MKIKHPLLYRRVSVSSSDYVLATPYLTLDALPHDVDSFLQLVSVDQDLTVRQNFWDRVPEFKGIADAFILRAFEDKNVMGRVDRAEWIADQLEQMFILIEAEPSFRELAIEMMASVEALAGCSDRFRGVFIRLMVWSDVYGDAEARKDLESLKQPMHTVFLVEKLFEESCANLPGNVDHSSYFLALLTFVGGALNIELHPEALKVDSPLRKCDVDEDCFIIQKKCEQAIALGEEQVFVATHADSLLLSTPDTQLSLSTEQLQTIESRKVSKMLKLTDCVEDIFDPSQIVGQHFMGKLFDSFLEYLDEHHNELAQHIRESHHARVSDSYYQTTIEAVMSYVSEQSTQDALTILSGSELSEEGEIVVTEVDQPKVQPVQIPSAFTTTTCASEHKAWEDANVAWPSVNQLAILFST